jgi:hypothetical protein
MATPKKPKPSTAAPAPAPAPTNIVSSDLGKALDGIGLSKYTELFENLGYRSLEDLASGGKADEAKKAIDAVVGDKHPGDSNRILKLWKEATTEGPKIKPQAPPKLPAGTKIDVTLEEFKLDNVSYEIPKSVGTPSKPSEVKLATELNEGEWLTLARKNRLTYGINLERALSPLGRGEFESDHAALVWVVPGSLDYLVADTASNTSSEMCYSSRVEQLSSARVVGLSLEVSAPFVGASAEAKRDEKRASTSQHKTLRMSGQWNYPRARLKLKYCTAVSSHFVDAIETALEKKDSQAQFEALDQVFQLYGHAVPAEVVLGGQMHFSHKREVTGTVDFEQVKNTVKAAATIKSPEGAGGGGGFSFEDGTGSKVTAQQISQLVKWECAGGDETLSDDPAKWRETVKNCNLWSVIERSGLVPLTDWLEADLRKKVLAVWDAGLKRLWSGHKPPKGYVFPTFRGMPFTISSGTGDTSPVISGVRMTEGKDKYGPYGILLSVTDGMSDPAEAGCYWQLAYTGRTTDIGFPIYWIIKHDADTAEDVSQLRKPVRSQPVLKCANADAHGRHYLGCRFTDQIFKAPIAAPGESGADKSYFWTVTQGWLGRYRISNLSSYNLLLPSSGGQKMSFIIGPECICMTPADRQGAY